MKIFISWSGERSQALALALRDWMPLVLHFAEPWLSTSDIKSGDRWNVEVAKGLQESKFGIICVTRDNADAPWLLFESGALAKSMDDGRVIPLRLDLEASEITGPLTQFQSEKADASGIRRLINSLNSVASAPVADERVNQLFGPLWDSLEGKIQAIPASGAIQKKSRPPAEIMEELVSGVRNVEMRIREMSDEEPGMRRRSRRRFDPMMINIMHEFGEDSGDPVKILIMASAFKDDLPWIYELAVEAYRAIKSGEPIQARKAFRQFKNTLEAFRRGPFLEMSGIDSKMIYRALVETSDLLTRFEFEAGLGPGRPVRKLRPKVESSEPLAED